MALAKAKEFVSSAPVVIFSKKNCGHCKWVKELLTQLGADFRVIELDPESDGSDIQSALAEWTAQKKLPIVFVGGNYIGACEGTKNFFTRMLQALEDASVVRLSQCLDIVKKFELSMLPAIDTVQLRSQLPTEKNHSMSGEQVTDSEDQEASDDDDDDRNHKHRRREAQSISSDDDVQELYMQQGNRRGNRSLDNRKNFHESSNNGNMESSSKFEKRRPIFTPGMRGSSDLSSRPRINQAFRSETGLYFNKSSSTGRPPVGRGRGRGAIPWSQSDSRFSALESLDFASQVVSQGMPTHPSLFVGTGIHNAASTQNASWGAYGFVPGMSSRILDPLQPLGLQGALQPTIPPLFNMGMPRPRCRDFDEQGYCLRGDMCPMEHGVNRIVVEDVQSLSQFNLSVTDPNSHALGIQAGPKSLPSVSAPLGLSSTSKFVPSKDGKSILTDDTLKLSGVSSAPGTMEADVYDPDQPLWNKESPDKSGRSLMLSLPNNGPLWNLDSSQQGHEQPNRVLSENIQSTTSTVWGRISHGSRPEMSIKNNRNPASTSHLPNEMIDGDKNSTVNASSAIPEKQFSAEMSKKATANQSHPRLGADSSRSSGKMSQKALRTLYVHGIPQKNNIMDALLSHFQKFGEVVDIYIPSSGDKAFVQFSKREEAEAALQAPDAVMGNRFIKLWWANHDRISNVPRNNAHTKLPPSTGMFPRPSGYEKEKLNLPSSVPSLNKTSTSELSVAVPVPKTFSTNTPKTVSPSQKKLEGLEFLKEELRKKQESLAQKRDEFRRQLIKFEKQTTVKKVDITTEQPAKRLKVDVGNELAKAGGQSEIAIEDSQQDVENPLQMRKSDDVLDLHASKENLTLENSNKEQTSHQPMSKLDEYSLDDRSTSFRILPLPADLTDVAVLQDHFSLFGDLTSVVLEYPKERSEDDGMKAHEGCSACVTFTSCDSARRAYISGKHWRGHSLQFMWLSDHSNSHKNHDGLEKLRPPESSSDCVLVDSVTSARSLPTEGNSSDAVFSEISAAVDGDSSEDLRCQQNDVPKAPLRISHSNPNILSCEEPQPVPDAQDVEDKMNIDVAE